MKAQPLLLTGPPGRLGLPQRALVLVEDGRPAGGFQDGKRIDAAEAAALLASTSWRARA